MRAFFVSSRHKEFCSNPRFIIGGISGYFLRPLGWEEKPYHQVMAMETLSEVTRKEFPPQSLLSFHLPFPSNAILVGGQFTQSHRPTGMKLISGDSDLGPEAKFLAVTETG